MTGGSEGGFEANKNLARAAQELGIPVGTGSVRVLFDHPELFHHFHLKEFAPDVPVMANLGSVQIRDRSVREIDELIKRLDVQALAVHLNPGQELFQPEGDRDFRGLKDALARLIEKIDIPVIVKETGFGIPMATVRELIDMGAAYVDLAGAGGTNWISVESYRLPEEERETAREFEDWGLPTAFLLRELAASDLRGAGKVLASGGIRSGMDAAKSLILGAHMAGTALPLIREERENGTEGILRYIGGWEKVLRRVMVLTGAPCLSKLRTRPYILKGEPARSREVIR